MTAYFPGVQAARIIANLLVAGGGVLFRAAAQAYRQAVVSECPCSGLVSWSEVILIFRYRTGYWERALLKRSVLRMLNIRMCAAVQTRRSQASQRRTSVRGSNRGR